jgi:GNAT superfamily N-acetyltransferase
MAARREKSVTIERATAADIGTIVPLFDAYRRFFAGRADLGRTRRFLEDRFAAGDSVIFVARAGALTVGFIQLYPLWSSWHCARVWFLSDLYVAEDSRNLGVGRALVERIIAHARETDSSSIIVELPRREPHLKDFYSNLGFVGDELFDLARRTFTIAE